MLDLALLVALTLVAAACGDDDDDATPTDDTVDDADPTDEERVKDAGRVLDRMFDKRRLDADDAENIARHGRTLAMVGFGAPVQVVIQRLRRGGLGSPELDVADAVVRLYLDPVTASARIQSLAVRDPGAAVRAARRKSARGAATDSIAATSPKESAMSPASTAPTA